MSLQVLYYFWIWCHNNQASTLILNRAALRYQRKKKKYFAFFSISQVAYWCPSSLYHFWMHWILLNTPSKRDFPKISENSHFEKYFDFGSGFLLSKNQLKCKKLLFKVSVGRYIIHLMTKLSLFRHSQWRNDVSGWIWAKIFFENQKLPKLRKSYEIGDFGS